jgi:hypothetical protein
MATTSMPAGALPDNPTTLAQIEAELAELRRNWTMGNALEKLSRRSQLVERALATPVKTPADAVAALKIVTQVVGGASDDDVGELVKGVIACLEARS